MNFHSSPAEPAFNAPRIVLVLIASFFFVHFLRTFVSDRIDEDILIWFAFIPARYAGEAAGAFPGGLAADAWTFVSYSFLHGGLTHLILNAVWLLVFGSPVAWRFGAARFLAFSAVTSIAGALAHLISHWTEFAPVIGASAVVSGATAAAIRFVFAEGGRFLGRGPAVGYVPAAPLRVALRDPMVAGFVVVWFVLNVAFGLVAGGIAWEAHLGGFLAGLLLFPWFDPPRRGGYLRTVRRA